MTVCASFWCFFLLRLQPRRMACSTEILKPAPWVGLLWCNYVVHHVRIRGELPPGNELFVRVVQNPSFEAPSSHGVPMLGLAILTCFLSSSCDAIMLRGLAAPRAPGLADNDTPKPALTLDGASTKP